MCGGANESGSEVSRGNLIPSRRPHDQLENFVHDPYTLWHIYAKSVWIDSGTQTRETDI